MAVAMFIRLPVAMELYDRLMSSLKLDVNPPPGEILHFAAETEDGLDICEVWQTRDGCGALSSTRRWSPRFAASVSSIRSSFVIYPLHNLYAADLDMIERIGAVSLPGVAPGASIRLARRSWRTPERGPAARLVFRCALRSWTHCASLHWTARVRHAFRSACRTRSGRPRPQGPPRRGDRHQGDARGPPRAARG